MERPNHRDMVYCHECENEWFRDEHGLACPDCSSDFTEIIESGHDPREDEDRVPGEPQRGGAMPAAPGGLHDAPDPDEDDIEGLRWEETGPGRYRLRGTYTRDVPMGMGQGQFGQPGFGPQEGAGAGLGAGLMGLVGNVLGGVIGGQQSQQQHGNQQQPQSRVQQAGSPPGSPQPEDDPLDPDHEHNQIQNPNNFFRHGHGPGYSYTIASSSNNANLPGRPPQLTPRNPHAPQPPQQRHPDHVEAMLNQMFANIGALPHHQPLHQHADPYADRPPHPRDPFGENYVSDPSGPSAPFGAPDLGNPAHNPWAGQAGPQGGLGGPIANLLNLFAHGPPGGVAGDAAYTQEGFDRIVSQLMEQHQAGNAPGPASEAAIAALPTKTIAAEDADVGSGRAECSICMDEAVTGAKVSLLPCGHWFHPECVGAWLREHDTCPQCRQGIMAKDGAAGAGAAGAAPGGDRGGASATGAGAGGGAAASGLEPGGGVRLRARGEAPLHDMRTAAEGGQGGDAMGSGTGTGAGQGAGGGAGVFGRMREAFGSGAGGASGGQSQGQGSGESGGAGNDARPPGAW